MILSFMLSCDFFCQIYYIFLDEHFDTFNVSEKTTLISLQILLVFVK